MKKRYLIPGDYMADPSVHVFEGKVYIYPSHDWESGIPEDDWGRISTCATIMYSRWKM